MFKRGRIVRSIKETPIFNGLYRLYTEYKVARSYVSKNDKDVFTKINVENKWGCIETASGPGSDLKQTQFIIREIPAFLKHLGVKTILDLPCGDHFWMKEADLLGFNYIGGDIVGKLIEQNNKLYGNNYKQFMIIDLTLDALPDADLILVRDCLVHLSFDKANSALSNLKKSGIKYLLTTTFPRTKINYDITTGNWRPLNLTRPPFNFPNPKQVIMEHCTESYGQYWDKSLGLWEIRDLPNYLMV